MHRGILKKAAKCKPSTEIGKNLKPIFPASKLKLPVNCSEANEEIQKDFGGPITSEKDQDIYFLACFNCFSKYTTVEASDKTNAPNVVKFSDE